MRYYVGIDPGLTGAICGIDTEGNILFLKDIPTFELNGIKHISVSHLSAYLDIRGATVAVERQMILPKQKAQDRIMMRYGEILAVCFLQGNVVHEVHPHTWKKDLLLTGQGKDGSVEKAISMNSEMRKYLQRKKDHDRAEAFLLAHYALRIDRI